MRQSYVVAPSGYPIALGAIAENPRRSLTPEAYLAFLLSFPARSQRWGRYYAAQAGAYVPSSLIAFIMATSGCSEWEAGEVLLRAVKANWMDLYRVCVAREILYSPVVNVVLAEWSAVFFYWAFAEAGTRQEPAWERAHGTVLRWRDRCGA